MNSVALENDNFLDFCAAREGGQFSRHEIELQLALLLYTQRHFLIQETVRLSQQDTKLSFNSFFLSIAYILLLTRRDLYCTHMAKFVMCPRCASSAIQSKQHIC